MKRSQADDFVVLPKLNFAWRMVVNAVLITAALFLQLECNGWLRIVGFGLVVFLVIFNWVRRVRITRDSLASATAWEPATVAGFRAALGRIKKIRRFVHTSASGFAFWLLVVFLAPIAVAVVQDFFKENIQPVIFVSIDVLLILFVVFSSGNRYIWSPRHLKLKLQQLLKIVARLQARREIRVQPQFLLQKKGTRAIPLDAKLMISASTGMPENLLGLQISLAVNMVQGKSYPYVYGVLVARSAFHLKKKLAEARKNNPGPGYLLLKVKSQAQGIDVAIFRQNTGIARGYWTRKTAVNEIVNHCTACLLSLSD